jgi:hypothetical protein
LIGGTHGGDVELAGINQWESPGALRIVIRVLAILLAATSLDEVI